MRRRSLGKTGVSVSEIGINGPQPAIANAVYNAVGAWVTEMPLTREKLLAGNCTGKHREVRCT